MEEKLFDLLNTREQSKLKIYKVENSELNKYVDFWCRNILNDNRKLLYSYDNESGIYIGVYNMCGECWVEEFDSEDKCISWLEGVDR